MARTRIVQKDQVETSADVHDEVKKEPIRIKEKGVPVRIRAGAGTNYEHVNGEYLGKGTFEVDEVSKGMGSKSGWGHLANGKGWVALDFVEILK